MMGFQDMLKQVQEVRERMQRLQEELGTRSVEGSAGGGMVVAVVNGKQELLDLRIEKEVVDPEEVGMLRDLVRAAVNDALARSREMAAAEMAKLTGGILPPGIF
jgi:DNA-binding YbaB/EbfC family protein